MLDLGRNPVGHLDICGTSVMNKNEGLLVFIALLLVVICFLLRQVGGDVYQILLQLKYWD